MASTYAETSKQIFNCQNNLLHSDYFLFQTWSVFQVKVKTHGDGNMEKRGVVKEADDCSREGVTSKAGVMSPSEG